MEVSQGVVAKANVALDMFEIRLLLERYRLPPWSFMSRVVGSSWVVARLSGEMKARGRRAQHHGEFLRQERTSVRKELLPWLLCPRRSGVSGRPRKWGRKTMIPLEHEHAGSQVNSR